MVLHYSYEQWSSHFLNKFVFSFSVISFDCQIRWNCYWNYYISTKFKERGLNYKTWWTHFIWKFCQSLFWSTSSIYSFFSLWMRKREKDLVENGGIESKWVSCRGSDHQGTFGAWIFHSTRGVEWMVVKNRLFGPKNRRQVSS